MCVEPLGEWSPQELNLLILFTIENGIRILAILVFILKFNERKERAEKVKIICKNIYGSYEKNEEIYENKKKILIYNL